MLLYVWMPLIPDKVDFLKHESLPGAMGEDAEDVKVKPEVASNVINIVVKDQNSGEVHFKVRCLSSAAPFKAVRAVTRLPSLTLLLPGA